MLSQAASRPRRSRLVGREHGSVTVEFALAMPVVVAMLAMGISATSWGIAVTAAQRGAGEGARAAIVETDASAIALASALGGGQAHVTRHDGLVTVCVTVDRPPWPIASPCSTVRDRP